MASDLWVLIRQQNRELGAIIREERTKAMLSQPELIAELDVIGIDVPALSRWEAGTMIPPSHHAEVLTHWLLFTSQGDHLQADLTAHARSTDPQTSHDAARSVSPDRMRDLHLWWLDHLAHIWRHDLDQLTMIGHPIGYSATDEGARLSYNGKTSDSGFRTRRAELRHAGYVEASGRRYPISTGREAIAWRLTPAGETLQAQRRHLDITPSPLPG